MMGFLINLNIIDLPLCLVEIPSSDISKGNNALIKGVSQHGRALLL